MIEVVLNLEWAAQTPEELQRDMPHLTLAQIYAALDYYHEHKDELDAEIAHGLTLVDRLREEAQSRSPVARPRAKIHLPTHGQGGLLPGVDLEDKELMDRLLSAP